MTSFHIRPETGTDIASVRDVEVRAFGQTLQADIVDALRASAYPQLSLVATVSDAIVGHVFFSPVTLAAGPANRAAQLSPLAVVPESQGEGIGSALVHEGIERCAGLGWSLVFVLGDPAFYRRFGFMPATRHGFAFGDKKAEPALQVLEVEPGALRGSSGLVRFHPAFDMAETAQ